MSQRTVLVVIAGLVVAAALWAFVGFEDPHVQSTFSATGGRGNAALDDLAVCYEEKQRGMFELCDDDDAQRRSAAPSHAAQELAFCTDLRFPVDHNVTVARIHVPEAPSRPGLRMACYTDDDICASVRRIGHFEHYVLRPTLRMLTALRGRRWRQITAMCRAVPRGNSKPAFCDDSTMESRVLRGGEQIDVEFIDIGANMGSLSFAVLQQSFPTTGFEVMPSNVQLLSTTTCLNGGRRRVLRTIDNAPVVEAIVNGALFRLFNRAIGSADTGFASISFAASRRLAAGNPSNGEITLQWPSVPMGAMGHSHNMYLLPFARVDTLLRVHRGPAPWRAVARRRMLDQLRAAGMPRAAVPSDFFTGTDFVVKIDVELSDLIAIEGMTRLLASEARPRMFIVEIWPQNNMTRHGEIFLSHGYKWSRNSLRAPEFVGAPFDLKIAPHETPYDIAWCHKDFVELCAHALSP